MESTRPLCLALKACPFFAVGLAGRADVDFDVEPDRSFLTFFFTGSVQLCQLGVAATESQRDSLRSSSSSSKWAAT